MNKPTVERHTKIVCTLGPASSSPEVIERMLRGGMDIARLNLAHSTLEEHRQLISEVRSVSQKLKPCMGILLDLPGPKRRIGDVKSAFGQHLEFALSQSADFIALSYISSAGEVEEVKKLLKEMNCLSYVFTRTKKRDVEIDFPFREARVIRVEFTPAEMDFYNAVTDFVADRFTARYGSSQGISFAVIMPQRQVASCIQAMKEKLDGIIKKRIVKAPSGDNGDIIDPSVDIDSPWRLEDGEVSALQKLKGCAGRVGEIDKKFDKFLEALRKLEKEDRESKIIVFAFFKKTLEYLRKRLEATEYRGKVALIHGDIPTNDRQKIIRRFRQTNEIKILLSSEVGGEGLDFEFCNVIFNYDLPWNPMRVEQRIGRLDRYGQRHEKILIVSILTVNDHF